MAEALYVNHLIDGNMKSSNKVKQIENVLSWSNQPIGILEILHPALGSGLVNPGQAFYRLRPSQVGFIIEFVERWKQKTATEREHFLLTLGLSSKYCGFDLLVLCNKNSPAMGPIASNGRHCSTLSFPILSRELSVQHTKCLSPKPLNTW